MYQVGALIVYGTEGVCRVESVGPPAIQGAQKGTDYYTLIPLYRSGKIFVPVDTAVHTRPVMTKEEAENLIDHIPSIPAEVYENSSPRLLNERYQALLKSDNCVDLVRLIRTVHAKERNAARKGRRLGQVDERNMKRAVEMLHGELAAALDMPMEEVENYLRLRIGALADASPAES